MGSLCSEYLGDTRRAVNFVGEYICLVELVGPCKITRKITKKIRYVWKSLDLPKIPIHLCVCLCLQINCISLYTQTFPNTFRLDPPMEGWPDSCGRKILYPLGILAYPIYLEKKCKWIKWILRFLEWILFWTSSPETCCLKSIADHSSAAGSRILMWVKSRRHISLILPFWCVLFVLK